MADQPYDIRYSQEAVEDLRGLRAFDQRKLLDGIDRHLRHQPTLVSRTRIKQTVQPFWCQFRLRVEDFERIMMWMDHGMQ